MSQREFIRSPALWTRAALLSLIFTLGACSSGGGDDAPAPPPPPPAAVAASVVIEQSTVTLFRANETRQLSARVLDAAGNPISSPVTWTSSAPNSIAVSASGLVSATLANASAEIRASAGTVTSGALLVVAATPAAGVVLINDANIVGDPVETTPGAAPRPTNTYRVTLSGMAAPSVGQLLLNTQVKPAAGRVVAVDTSGANPVVTLTQVGVSDLLPNFSLNVIRPLAGAAVTVPAEISNLFTMQRVGNKFTFTPKVTTPKLAKAGPLSMTGKCHEPGSGLLMEVNALPFTISASSALDFTVDGDGYWEFSGGWPQRLGARIDVRLQGGIHVDVATAFEREITCYFEFLDIPIPSGSVLDAVAGVSIPVGISLDIGGEMTLANVRLGVRDLDARAHGTVALRCPGGVCNWQRELDIDSYSFKPDIDTNTLGDIADPRFEPTIGVNPYTGVSVGSRWFESLRADIYRIKFGRELSASFAFDITQMAATDYESEYSLDQVISLGFAADVIETTRALLKVTLDLAPLEWRTPIARSPQLLATQRVFANRAEFDAGETVQVTLHLDPAHAGFTSIFPYNVQRIRLLRPGIGNAVELASVAPTAGQTDFQISFVAPASGRASDIHAFVTTTALPFNLLALELGTAGANSIAGSVSGLAGSGLQLRNGNEDLAITQNGAFAFRQAPTTSANYNVTVVQQPANPLQNCVVSNGSGAMPAGGVSNVQVSCTTTPTYSLGGTLSGLSGSSVRISNGSDHLTLSTNGAFTFGTRLLSGANYAVTATIQPMGQACAVTRGSGTVAAANVTNIAVVCAPVAPTTYALGGSVTGLGTGTLTLTNNGGDNLAVIANGSFAFATRLASGVAYNVQVSTAPLGQGCTVANGIGTVASQDVTNVTVTCTNNAFTVGGSVTGLTGSGLVLRNSGGNDLVITGNGAFTFTNAVTTGTTYSVIVATQPSNPAQSCGVQFGSGTMASSNITNVLVTCGAVSTIQGATSIALGLLSRYFITADNSLHASGYNQSGQLGLGNTEQTASGIPNIPAGVASISAHDTFAILLTPGGTVMVAGENQRGQLGTGDRVLRNVFTPVFSNATYAVAGGGFIGGASFVISSTGDLWAAGGNNSGQLGTNDISDRNTFQSVLTGGVKSVSSGTYHTVAVKADGTLWGTGYNTRGQLGIGDLTNRRVFAQSTVYSNVRDAVAGADYSLVLLNNGTLIAHGDGYGTGRPFCDSPCDRRVGVAVLTDVKLVRTGLDISFALKNDGTLWSTGRNDYGELGTGDNVTQETFVQVPITGVVDFAVESTSAVVLKSDGTLWAAGSWLSPPAGIWTFTQIADGVRLP